MHEITVVSRKNHKGESEYVGREMPGLKGSPLGNDYRVKPHGPYEREEAIGLYRRWLWERMQDREGPVYRELARLKALAEKRPIALSCWCSPLGCHADVVRAAILYLAKAEADTEGEVLADAA